MPSYDEYRDSHGRTFSEAVADHVMEAIATSGMSIRAVARETGIPPSRLHGRLHNEYYFNTDELARIAAVLGVAPQAFVLDD